MFSFLRRSSTLISSVAVAVLLASCTEKTTAPGILAPSRPLAPSGPQFGYAPVHGCDNLTPATTCAGSPTTNSVRFEELRVCKVYPGGTGPDVEIKLTANFVMFKDGPQSGTYTLRAGECLTLWRNGEETNGVRSTDIVTVSETPVPGYTTTSQVTTIIRDQPDPGPNRTFTTVVGPVTSAATITSNIGGARIPGALIVFTNTAIPPVLSACTIAYPYQSANPRTNVEFNESEVLAGISLGGPAGNPTVQAFYTDEHALLLGVRATGFPVTPMGSTNPGHAVNPAIGDPNQTDDEDRPFFPSLFITDISLNPNSTSGDWQFFGTPTSPNDLFGTWKGAEVTLTGKGKKAKNGIVTDDDPARNGSSLGAGSDTPPAAPGGKGKKGGGQGYTAEARWNLNALIVGGSPLLPGHTYRLQLMVHDGDQNKIGGDVGEACANVFFPGSGSPI